MTEHMEEGRSGQQGKEGYFSREKHKPQERIKGKTKGKVEMESRNRTILICPTLTLVLKTPH